MELKNRIYNTMAFAATTFNSSSTVAYGTAIDKTGYESCKVTGFIGAVGNSAVLTTLTFTLQESSDNSTFTNVTSSTTYVTSAAITNSVVAANQWTTLNKNLSHLKKYIRVAITPSFNSAGTNFVVGGAVISLGMAKTLPTS